MRRLWYVLHVKPRTEKKTAEYLRQYRLWHHLPLYRKVTRVQRRKVVRELPLFPGYVFARLNPQERVLMLRTNLVVRTIDVPRPREMIHQLRQIAHAGRAGKEVRKVEKFTVGEPVPETENTPPTGRMSFISVPTTSSSARNEPPFVPYGPVKAIDFG